jgi:hypothetical protein
MTRERGPGESVIPLAMSNDASEKEEKSTSHNRFNKESAEALGDEESGIDSVRLVGEVGAVGGN